MKLMLTNDHGEVHSIDISDEMTLSDMQALIECDMNIPNSNQQIFHHGNLLDNKQSTIKQLGINQDDIILVRNNAPVPTVVDQAEEMRQRLIGNPQLMAQLTQQNPRLADLARNNPAEFSRALNQSITHASAANSASAADHDPFDVEAQKKIEDEIRRQNIQGNMENALEHHPESFGRVVMLYIKCEVNGHPVDAFVDSGAQATIMSPDCANTCNITRLVDERFAGIAQGVGTAKILGRVHSAQIKIGTTFLPCSFTIMEGKGVDLLFGLDMLKRHQACIDLKDNVLRIAGQNVPFLSEHELSLKARGEAQSPETPKPATNASSKPNGSINTTNASSCSSSSSSKYPVEKIKTLTDLGFSREEAIGALDACNGDADAAANMLF